MLSSRRVLRSIAAGVVSREMVVVEVGKRGLRRKLAF